MCEFERSYMLEFLSNGGGLGWKCLHNSFPSYIVSVVVQSTWLYCHTFETRMFAIYMLIVFTAKHGNVCSGNIVFVWSFEFDVDLMYTIRERWRFSIMWGITKQVHKMHFVSWVNGSYIPRVSSPLPTTTKTAVVITKTYYAVSV